ncbi:Pancreatic lipase-related protein 2 like protein [Argiope bruennichi]|uniref:Pancreatic lipase-related protein 2 like protein n=2 Tax=Argiope bruennichi TaxID=94029 RepID=A0A8T0FDI9_ARGBR|nr:Pancreatic lipase-related protein 2 like protein [Argiope bruennichi]
MASVAILCLLLLERFLASDMDTFTEPVLNGLRVLEKTALGYTSQIVPGGYLRPAHKLSRFYLFTPEYSGGEGLRLWLENPLNFRYFNPHLETKVIIHGFLDKVKIADWMHDMKNEFLMLDSFNVIVVDWSFGNFIPYSKAAANTERVGEEISELLIKLRDEYGAMPERFHLIGHSLGSHVAGYVGEIVKGLKRITGLDPATYLFSDASTRTKLDRTDASFVDVIHTDGGGIGMVEPVGHVDFYPNGGQIQAGCTASNSLRALLEKGVVEGVRNMICSHMRAPLLFTSTINAQGCQPIGYRCGSWEAFTRGECDSCGPSGEDCAHMGYHMSMVRNYGNLSMYYMLTADSQPYCGFEYKITLKRDIDPADGNSSEGKDDKWPTSDILHVSLYGSSGNANFQIEGKKGIRRSHVLFSPTFLGDVVGAVIRWSKRPLSRAQGMMDMISTVIQGPTEPPSIRSIYVSSLKTYTQWRIAPIVFELCVSPLLPAGNGQQGATFRSEYC